MSDDPQTPDARAPRPDEPAWLLSIEGALGRVLALRRVLEALPEAGRAAAALGRLQASIAQALAEGGERVPALVEGGAHALASALWAGRGGARPAEIASLFAARAALLEATQGLVDEGAWRRPRARRPASARGPIRTRRALLAHLAEHGELRGVEVEDLRAIDLDLTGICARGARFRRVDLSGARLGGADLSGAQLSGARLSGAKLDGAKLASADLTLADLRGSSLREVDLTGALLVDTRLDGADAAGVDFSVARRVARLSLRGTDLTGARLDRADLGGVDLSSARVSGASFKACLLGAAQARGLDFTGCDLADASLRGADLRDLVAPGLHAPQVSLRDADLRGARLASADLTGADARGATFERADLQGATLDDACLEDARLCDCILRAASLRGARLGRADLGRSSFAEATLTHADLSHTDLRGTTFVGADLRFANLHRAKSGADFTAARLEGVTHTDMDRAASEIFQRSA